MKKIILCLMVLLSIIFSFATSATDTNIMEVTDNMIQSMQNRDDIILFLGKTSPAKDVQASTNIMLSLGKQVGAEKVYPNSTIVGKRDHKTQNIVIIGGPCANELWAQYSSETCDDWPYKPGESIIKVASNGDYNALLIAGTTGDDTIMVSNHLKDYKTSSDFLSLSNKFGEPITHCGDNICHEVENDENCQQDCPTENSVKLTEGYAPLISGNKVIFIRKDKKGSGFYIYNLESDDIESIDTKGIPTGFYENNVVLYSTNGEKHETYLYNLNKREPVTLSSQSSSKGFPTNLNHPDIYGDYVVWGVYDDVENFHLTLYNLETQDTEEIELEGTSAIPKLYGKLLVFKDHVSDYETKLYTYNIQTKRKTDITDSNPYKSVMTTQGHFPNNDQDYFVFEKVIKDTSDIYLYDISSKETKRITTNSKSQWNPDIDGDRIVWEDERNGKAEIYFYTLS